MRGRAVILVLSLTAVVTIALLAPGLHEIRFEPGRPLFPALETGRIIVLPALTIPKDTPVWKLVLFWLAVVVSLALLFLLLPQILRRRILRQLIRLSLGVLLLLLALRSGALKWPELAIEPAAQGQPGTGALAAAAETADFRPPAFPAWLTLAASLIVLWLVGLMAYLAYGAWRLRRSRNGPALDLIAQIARVSLADLAAGRDWGDVVTSAYARMLGAVQTARGIQRESSSTPREFVRLLGRTGLPLESVEELTLLFESVRYGGRASADVDSRRAAACLESILQACGLAA
jgi:hypothetical protein